MFSSNREKGSLTLETALVLPFFFFLFMFVIGYFGVLSARNSISHALIQATKSLSFDSYANESFETLGIKEEGGLSFWNSISDMVASLIRVNADPKFADMTKWYKSLRQILYEHSVVHRIDSRFAGSNRTCCLYRCH